MDNINIKASFTVTDDGSLKQVGAQATTAAKGLNAAGKGATTADRNLKGAAQASSNATKNFSKMAQGISGTLVPAYATLAANIFALTAVFGFFKQAADIKNLEQSQVAFAQNTGTAVTVMSAKLKEASKDMLGYREAAEAAAIGMAKGFSPTQMNNIAEGALKVSNVLGRDFQDSFNRLTRGISKAEPELLDELGITLRLEKATKDYAEALGKSVDSLTAAERSQAIYINTMKQLEKVTAGAEANANPFVQLGNTFNDLIRNITQFLLPAFEGLAKFINNNAVVALAFFSLIGASIVKSFAPIDEMKSKFGQMMEKQKQSLEKSRNSLAAYRKEIEKTKQSTAFTQAKGSLGVQRGAAQALQAGSKSKMLQNIASGQADMFKGTTKANLQKALKAAEADYAKHGKITKGIFKGVGIEIVRSIGGSLEQTQVKAMTSTQKIGMSFKRLGMRAKALKATIGIGLTRALGMAGKAASMFGSAMNKAMKATFILGMIQMIYDMVMSLINAPASILQGIINVAKGAMKLIEGIVNTAIDAINYVIRLANKIPGVDITQIGQANFAAGVNASMDEFMEKSEFVQDLRTWENERQGAIAADETISGLTDKIKEYNKQITLISTGKAFQEGATDLEKSKATLNAIASMGVSSLLEDIVSIKDPEKKQEALKKLKNELKGLGDIYPKLEQAVTSGDFAGAQEIEAKAQAVVANVAAVKDGIGNLGKTLTASTSPYDALVLAQSLSNTANSAEQIATELGLTVDSVQALDEAFKNAGGVDEFATKMQKFIDKNQEIAQGRSDLQMSRLESSATPSLFQGLAALDQNVIEQQLNLSEKQNQLNYQKSLSVIKMTEAEKTQHQEKIAQLEREIALQQKQVDIAKKNATDIGRIGSAVGEALSSSMTQAFQGLVDGSMKAKDAFKSMATSILQSISKIITELLVAKLLQSSLGGTSFGSFLGIPAKRYGGVVSNGKDMPGYATGGIAKGPQSGYPVMMHGTEAVVPLPNGKSIPVEMSGAAGQQNNISVSVNVASDGTANTSVQGDAGGMDLGKAVAQAVQEELQNQKRSGGLLSPYGVA